MSLVSMDGRGLAGVMDELLYAERSKSRVWQFAHLVRVLDQVDKVNPHQHITGSVGGGIPLKLVIQTYRRDHQARSAFLAYAEAHRLIPPQERSGFFDQRDDDLMRWFQRQIPLPRDPNDFQDADDHLSLLRLAFQSRHEDKTELLREAYRRVALENAAHGVREVWFRTCLGDDEGETLLRSAQAAIEGAVQAEIEAGVPLRVRFLIGMRKQSPETTGCTQLASFSDAKAMATVEGLISLEPAPAHARRKIFGVDSVGMDSRWLPEWQAKAREVAAANGFHVAVHFGESWPAGELLRTLERMETLVRGGVIDQLDNANALFAVNELEDENNCYTEAIWDDISRLQVAIFGLLVKRGIILGINPTSNDWLTRSLRRREGWRFRRHDEPLGGGLGSVVQMISADDGQQEHLKLVVGNDNSRIYPSRIAGSFLTVSEELANLWKAPGSSSFSVYGKLPTRVIAQFIYNGSALAKIAKRGLHHNPGKEKGISMPSNCSELEYTPKPIPASRPPKDSL